MELRTKKMLQAAGVSLLAGWAIVGTALALNPQTPPAPQTGICYNQYQAPYLYTPTIANGVETCFGGTFVATNPLPQQ